MCVHMCVHKTMVGIVVNNMFGFSDNIGYF